jgi:hypothetical protein
LSIANLVTVVEMELLPGPRMLSSGDKRYVRRDDKGHFTKEVNVGRSLAADRRAHAKKTVKPGQGDRGDVKR